MTRTKPLTVRLSPNVNAVAPHAIEKEMSAQWSEEKRRSILDAIPLKRLGTPDDVAEPVLFCLTELFVRHGIPEHIRSDNTGEFMANAVRQCLAHMGVQTLYIEPGSPWENGYNESFVVGFFLYRVGFGNRNAPLRME